MASVYLRLVPLLATAVLLTLACQQDKTIHCRVDRQSEFLPPPSVALIHCETSLPGNLRVLQRDEISPLINYTDWDVNPQPCLYKLNANCAHIFLRIDSIPDQRNITICRTFQSNVCTCLDLSEPPQTTTSTSASTTSPAIHVETTSQTDASSTTQNELNPVQESGGNRGSAVEDLTSHAGFMTIVVLTVSFVIVIAVMGTIWVITCWHYKKKLLILQKADIERSPRPQVQD